MKYTKRSSSLLEQASIVRTRTADTSPNTRYHFTICVGLFAMAIGFGITSKDD
jgi:hypothetical protein